MGTSRRESEANTPQMRTPQWSPSSEASRERHARFREDETPSPRGSGRPQFWEQPGDRRGFRSREQSPERSPSPPRRHSADHQRRRRESRSPSPRYDKHDDDLVKPWFKKKTVWTTVATLATVAALVPATASAKASRDAARASHESATASHRSANAVEKSAVAVVNSSIAQGHMDHRGRYTGPLKHIAAEADSYRRPSAGGGRGPPPRRAIEARPPGHGRRQW